MNDLKLPPRQRKIIQRKPDPSLSRSETSRKKLNSTHNTAEGPPLLDVSFISLKDSCHHTPRKLHQSPSIPSLFHIKTRNQSPTYNNQYGCQQGKHKTYAETAVKNKGSFNIKDVQNTLQNLSETKSHNDMIRLKLQNESLISENKRLKQQIQIVKKDKGVMNNVRIVDQLSQYKKQNQQMRYQCLYMTSTISELEQKINLNKQEYSELKGAYQANVSQLSLLRQAKTIIESVNRSLVETCNSLKIQVQVLSQQIRYLNISIEIHNRTRDEAKKIEKQNDIRDQLRKKNKQLQTRIIQLKQRVLLDDIVELTPEKDHR